MNELSDLTGAFSDVPADAAPSRIPVTLARWPLPLHGPRITLRALGEQDIENFRLYRSDPEVARYQGWSTMDRREAKAFIDSMQDVKGPRLGQWVQFGIALRSDDHLIGDIGLHFDATGRVAQIGYSCATRFQRKGLTSEAVGVLIGGVFEHTGCERIRAVIDTRNIPSERLLLRLGFVPVATESVLCGEAAYVEVTYELRSA